MSQSLSDVNIHLVFSTKNRRPFLQDAMICSELHKYLGGVSGELGCPPIRVGGVADHVHLLIRLGRTIALADGVKELKRSSSLWIKDRSATLADFQWQNGYAVFSVSHSHVESVRDYIERQEEHHRSRSFEDELRLLLERHQLIFDERYVWD